jgi:activator of HSP90 ATPase
MTFNLFTRRDFSLGLASVFAALGAKTALGSTAGLPATGLQARDEISRTSETIHQEVIFKATRQRVYEALTDQKQFNKVVQLSAAGMSFGNAPVEISHEAGGAFSIFGGYIVGRQIELVANERIVQAWRASSWKPGIYSIARFQLNDQDAGTRLVFDHTGFPDGLGQHLAEGWKSNYWSPLEKYLAA